MKRLFVTVLAVCLCYLGSSFAQEEHSKEHAAAPAGKTAPKLDKAYMQQVWDAWCTLDPNNAAKFYGKGKEHVFFDIAPLKYQGWDSYAKGASEFFKTIKSAKAKINDDVQIHHEGPIAWSLATLDFTMTDKQGKTSTVPVRWTAIWHNHGTNWVIAHEHVSAPMPEEQPKQ